MNTDNDRKNDLAQRPLSFTEAVFLADNLETIDNFVIFREGTSKQPHRFCFARDWRQQTQNPPSAPNQIEIYKGRKIQQELEEKGEAEAITC